jgi:hypothetical protein
MSNALLRTYSGENFWYSELKKIKEAESEPASRRQHRNSSGWLRRKPQPRGRQVTRDFVRAHSLLTRPVCVNSSHHHPLPTSQVELVSALNVKSTF